MINEPPKNKYEKLENRISASRLLLVHSVRCVNQTSAVELEGLLRERDNEVRANGRAPPPLPPFDGQPQIITQRVFDLGSSSTDHGSSTSPPSAHNTTVTSTLSLDVENGKVI